MNNVLGFAQVPVLPKDCTCSVSSYSHVMTLIIKDYVLTEAKNAFFFFQQEVCYCPSIRLEPSVWFLVHQGNRFPSTLEKTMFSFFGRG